MTKDEALTNLILESMRDEVAEFVKTQGEISSSIEYEEEVLRIARKFASGLISTRAGKIPKDRNAKKKF